MFPLHTHCDSIKFLISLGVGRRERKVEKIGFNGITWYYNGFEQQNQANFTTMTFIHNIILKKKNKTYTKTFHPLLLFYWTYMHALYRHLRICSSFNKCATFVSEIFCGILDVNFHNIKVLLLNCLLLAFYDVLLGAKVPFASLQFSTGIAPK